jgi:hypothetical protein
MPIAIIRKSRIGFGFAGQLLYGPIRSASLKAHAHSETRQLPIGNSSGKKNQKMGSYLRNLSQKKKPHHYPCHNKNR